MHAWADMMHQNSTPHLQLKSCCLFFFQWAPPTKLEMAGFVGQMERALKKKVPFPTLCLSYSGPETKWQHQQWVMSMRAAACATSALAQRPVDNSNVLSTLRHSAHIPWFVNGRGQTLFLPWNLTWNLEIKCVGERERDSNTNRHLNLSIKSAKIHYLGFVLYHFLVLLFQCFFQCRFCNSLLYVWCPAEHHR